MNRILLLLCLWAISVTTIFAGHVDEKTANRVGRSFCATKPQSTLLKSSSSLTLNCKVAAEAAGADAKESEVTYFYVFNTEGGGFVIVAGDDCVTPILGYSNEGTFDLDNIPPNAQAWIDGYKEQIQYVIDNKVSATAEIQKEWKNYSDDTAGDFSETAAIDPLIKTEWDQGQYYNAQCPTNTPTGCVATAMAQVMKYWNHPAKGTGSKSYSHATYGTLSANFANTTYQWSSMPDKLTGASSAVATLMYHAGVSVEMNYSTSTSGSSASTVSHYPGEPCAETALITYFGYKNTIRQVWKEDFTQAQWIELLKYEIDVERPILYRGSGSAGGHSFVCDAYDSRNYFHFNWGWSGSADGFYAVTALNPSGYAFNTGQAALIGIEPATSAPAYDLVLADKITASASTIEYGKPFSVTVKIGNSGTGAFTGDLCVGVLDSENNFGGYVKTVTGKNLQAGSQEELVFGCEGLPNMLFGKYHAMIFYRLSGTGWLPIPDNDNFKNYVEIEVSNPGSILLYAPITVSSDTMIKGASVSVKANFINFKPTAFVGKYRIGIHNLDSTLVCTINTYNETKGLGEKYYYVNPLTFTGVVNAEPGTYFLAATYQPAGSDDWKFAVPGEYKNPIKITVKAIPPDKYEENNTEAQAYALPVVFSNNTANVNTEGSDFHINTDVDYYKIALPSGYNYTIAARLHDSYKSGNGKKYTVDAKFAYLTGGTSWSKDYDESSDFVVRNGGTVYFRVNPYTAGKMGTYLLDVNITRALPNSNANLSALTVSPGTLTPTFNANTTNYTVNVANKATSINVTATKADTYAAVAGTGTHTLAVGNNTINVAVTAENGTTVKTYVITVIRSATPNNNADLQTLSVNTGTLTPAFNANTIDYTVNVPYKTTSIIVSATKSDTYAAVTGVGTHALNPGNNIIRVIVTAENGTTVKTYTITAVRAAPANNADLKSLSVSSGTLAPTFNAGTTDYTASVANTVTSVTVSASAADANAAVSGQGSKALALGKNTATITVTAEDKTTAKTYTIVITRMSNDKSLTGITVNGERAALKPGSATDYEVFVDYTTSIEIVAAANHAAAVVAAADVGAKPVTTGLNVFTVKVTAEDKSAASYRLEVNVRTEIISGIEDQESNPLTVYPNPARDYITVGGLQSAGILKVFDAAGKPVLQHLVTSPEERLYVGNFPQGVYILTVENDGQRKRIKFVKGY